MSEGDSTVCIKVVLGITIFVVLAGIGAGVYGYFGHINNKLDALEKQLANLTNGFKIDREVTSRTMKLLGNETEQLKEDYMKLQSETRALNKTVNYTTSATVQRALSELKNVKETQNVIRKDLERLSHLNDTTEDYLNLREQVNNLTTRVNKNISRLEIRIIGNRRDFESEVSKINSDVSNLEKRLNETAGAASTMNLIENPKLKLVLCTIALATLEITQHI